MRLWLGAAFALVSLITAASVYVFVDDSSGRTLQSESADLAVGKTSGLADDLGSVDKLHAANVLAQVNSRTFKAWALNRHGHPLAPGQDPPVSPPCSSGPRPFVWHWTGGAKASPPTTSRSPRLRSSATRRCPSAGR